MYYSIPIAAPFAPLFAPEKTTGNWETHCGRLLDKNPNHPRGEMALSGLGRCSSHPQGPLSASSKAAESHSCFKKTDVICSSLSASPYWFPLLIFLFLGIRGLPGSRFIWERGTFWSLRIEQRQYMCSMLKEAILNAWCPANLRNIFPCLRAPHPTHTPHPGHWLCGSWRKKGNMNWRSRAPLPWEQWF